MYEENAIEAMCEVNVCACTCLCITLLHMHVIDKPALLLLLSSYSQSVLNCIIKLGYLSKVHVIMGIGASL